MNPFDFAPATAKFLAEASDPLQRAAARTVVARRDFPAAVEAAGWKYLLGGGKLTPDRNSRIVVVGVAPWSLDEMAALGALSGRTADPRLQIYAFDIDSCRSIREVGLLLPGVPPPLQTPVVAEYANGTLAMSLTGEAATRWLTDVAPSEKPTRSGERPK